MTEKLPQVDEVMGAEIHPYILEQHDPETCSEFVVIKLKQSVSGIKILPKISNFNVNFNIENQEHQLWRGLISN